MRHIFQWKERSIYFKLEIRSIRISLFPLEIKVWSVSMSLPLPLWSKRTSFSQSNGLTRIKSASFEIMSLCSHILLLSSLSNILSGRWHPAGILVCSLGVTDSCNSWAPRNLRFHLRLFQWCCAKEDHNIWSPTRFWGPNKPIIQKLMFNIEIQNTR